MHIGVNKQSDTDLLLENYLSIVIL